jgi:hypothetical protein
MGFSNRMAAFLCNKYVSSYRVLKCLVGTLSLKNQIQILLLVLKPGTENVKKILELKPGQEREIRNRKITNHNPIGSSGVSIDRVH